MLENRTNMKGYKAFKKGLVCREKQYKENTVFEEDYAKICESGMHFCANPLDTLNYYGLLDEDCELNDFAEVEALEAPLVHGDKFCTKKLKIGKKMDLKKFIEASFKCIYESDNVAQDTSQFTMAVSRNRSHLAVSRKCLKLASSGNSSQQVSLGDFSQSALSGNHSYLAASGDFSNVASSGDASQIMTSGVFSQSSVSGDYSQLAASGEYSKLATVGISGYILALGDFSNLATLGKLSKLRACGANSRLAALENDSSITVTGENSIAVNVGKEGMVKGVKGTWITLAEYKDDECICVKSAQIDGEKLKENTFYTLENGNFVEV